MQRYEEEGGGVVAAARVEKICDVFFRTGSVRNLVSEFAVVASDVVLEM